MVLCESLTQHLSLCVAAVVVRGCQMTAEAILRLLSDPVLPFYPLDIALDVQNKLKGISPDSFMRCIFIFF